MEKVNSGLRVRVRVSAGLCALGLGLALLPAAAAAGEMFKCGKTFQDRPCESEGVQQRFSRTQGTFAIQQVNPQTDHTCARIAAEAMPWWERLARGEPLEKLNAEIDAQKTSRYDKSAMRELLTVLQTFKGTPVQVRSEFETRCMANLRRKGYTVSSADATGTYASEAEARRAEDRARRVEQDGLRAQAQAERQARQADARAEHYARQAQVRAEREARLREARAR